MQTHFPLEIIIDNFYRERKSLKVGNQMVSYASMQTQIKSSFSFSAGVYGLTVTKVFSCAYKLKTGSMCHQS